MSVSFLEVFFGRSEVVVCWSLRSCAIAWMLMRRPFHVAIEVNVTTACESPTYASMRIHQAMLTVEMNDYLLNILRNDASMVYNLQLHHR